MYAYKSLSNISTACIDTVSYFENRTPRLELLRENQNLFRLHIVHLTKVIVHGEGPSSRPHSITNYVRTIEEVGPREHPGEAALQLRSEVALSGGRHGLRVREPHHRHSTPTHSLVTWQAPVGEIPREGDGWGMRA